jgi:carboxymethylenebutenolidase
VPHERAVVRTSDGTCITHVLTPEGAGPWPAAVMYMDAGGIRPAMIDMARRLAEAGHVVLLPDLFYRYGPYGPFVPKDVLAGDFRAILGPLMATTGNDKAAEDTGALIAYLDTRSDVADRRIGAVGFCMGGGMAIGAAAAFPDRFAAVASFHGGNLATDAPTSPHRGAPRIEAEVYVAAAEDDRSYPPEMAARLEAALSDAGVRFRAETYPAEHGWMMPDFPVYDQEAAERGWSNLAVLYGRILHHPDVQPRVGGP